MLGKTKLISSLLINILMLPKIVKMSKLTGKPNLVKLAQWESLDTTTATPATTRHQK